MPGKPAGYIATGAGILLVYSGITGRGILATLVQLVRGQSPAAAGKTQLIQSSAGDVGSAAGAAAAAAGAAAGGTGSPRQILESVAAQRGWTGAQWTALDAIENQEAGYNPTAKNPQSGAYGMAQSLGHGYSGGPAPNGVNEYGGVEGGLNPAESQAASMGNAYWQSVWMCNYIAARYGDPVTAEQFHLAHGYY